MSPSRESRYRLRLAESRLRSAEGSLGGARWADCALFARAAIENGAKALLACFRAVPRTHEPADVVRAALEDPTFPEALRGSTEALVPVLAGYGLARHLALSYGDEQNLRLPEELVSEADARGSLADAQSIIDLARRVCESRLGPP